MHIITHDKTIGLKIRYAIARFRRYLNTRFRKERIVTLSISGGYCNTQIVFRDKEFIKFCDLLSKTKSDKELKKEIAQLPYPEKGIHAYAGIYYVNEKPQLMFGSADVKDVGKAEAQDMNRRFIGESFQILDCSGSVRTKFDKKTKKWKIIRSKAPVVRVFLPRDAFFKFRSACLRAVSIIKRNKHNLRK